MARYAAEQIYAFARQAGFGPDAATTMTAVALAESGGRSGAHNPVGEDSRGLWQINARAHPDLAQLDLYDPAQNARAAFEVSGGGRDISPWTVTHGGSSARYLPHRDAAQAAAVAYGDGPGLGVWTGTAGYGDRVAAGGAADGVPAEPPAGPPLDGPDGPASGSGLQRFLDAALAQKGDRYVFGAETSLDDADPETFDCSELVQWAAHQAGVTVPDGAANQYMHLKQLGLVVPVDEARDTPGALLFTFSHEPRPGEGRQSTAHVAISLGDGMTIEAKNPRVPVGSFEVGNRFTFAAVIPGISDAAGLAAAAAPTPPPVPDAFSTTVLQTVEPVDLGGTDSDRDGLTDVREAQDGTDARREDTDDDGLGDGWERAHGSDPRLANTDGDLLPDAYEFSRGSDPADPDSDLDGHLDGALADSWVDVDGDAVDDPLEALLRLDATRADTDADGFTDRLELDGGWDPADPLDQPGREPTPDPFARAGGDAADPLPTD